MMKGGNVGSPLGFGWKHNYTGAQKHTGLCDDFSILPAGGAANFLSVLKCLQIVP